MKNTFKLLILLILSAIFTQNAFAFDPYYSSTGDGVTVDVNDDVVTMHATNPTSSRTAYQFIQLGTNYNFNLGYHLGTPALTGGITERTQQIQFGFASNNKGWDGFSNPENYAQDPNFETFRFMSVTAGTNVSKNGVQQNYWGVANSLGLDLPFPYFPPDAECHMLSCAEDGHNYFPLNSIETTGKPRSNADGIIYGDYNSSKDELAILAAEKRSGGGFTDPTLLATLKPKATGLSNFFVGGIDITNAKVTAAPEPVTTTLFLVGGGVMALGKLRRKKV
jgi:hypothetical protein